MNTVFSLYPRIPVVHIAYVDEPGFRRTGWPPLGTSAQISPSDITCIWFRRYCSFAGVPGSTDANLIEDFNEQLLQYSGRWPELNTVLVMDNVRFHRSDRTEELCPKAGVKLLYLLPYSPGLSPIE